MEEEFEEIEVEYAPLLEGHEIDVDYEFDAPQFCDFTRQETFWDASEAEQWFEFAASYPPSPFLLKMKWGSCGGMKRENIVVENSGPSMEPEQVSDIEEDNSTGLEYYNETINGKTKPLSKSSSSKAKDFSFMKPTASHLAKQKNPSEVQTPRSLRFQTQNSSTDGQLTKRQKLEAGYLSKVARLKHHILFTHKKTKEVDRSDFNVASKPNVTIAKEPNLVTAVRAQRHKSRTNAESGGPTQSSSQVLKARPLNKKILEGTAQVFSKMKTPRLTEFQVFHLRTSERAMQNISDNAGNDLNSNSISNSETRDLRRTNSSVVGSRQEKCRTNDKLRGSRDNKLSSKSERGVFRNIKVYPLEPNDKESLNEPPTELFSKLSLASEVKQSTKSPSKEQPISKGLKENRPGSLRQEQELPGLCNFIAFEIFIFLDKLPTVGLLIHPFFSTSTLC
ncbi:TPX2 protein [Spatholobus suberectus]|nr:TPX2 protein [Spatholobus suberectus]